MMNYSYYIAVLVLILIPLTCSANKLNMLKENKTPKKAVDQPTPNDACTECQTLVKRIKEAMKDDTKMAELKILLKLMCEQTSYKEECLVIVSKLDVIVKYLVPELV